MGKVFTAGLHDLPADVYHGDPCPEPSLSAGLAWKLIDESPLHAWTASLRLNPYFEAELKEAFDIGSAAHELLTGRGRGIHVVDADSYRTKAAQEERDTARADGLVPLLRDQFDRVEAMMEAARLQLDAHGIGDPFARGRAAGSNEVTMIWQADGIWCRAMADTVDHEAGVIYDYKTSAGLPEPQRWVRGAMAYGVDLRAAHYLDGVNSLLPGRAWRYRFVVQEKKPPHALAVLELSPDTLAIGRKKLARARELWARCLATDEWPGLDTRIAIVAPPAFFEDDWLGREEREADNRRRTGRDPVESGFRFKARPSASALKAARKFQAP